MVIVAKVISVELAELRGERISNENVDIFEVVVLQGRCDLQLLVIEFKTIQDSLLLKLDLPSSASDRVA